MLINGGNMLELSLEELRTEHNKLDKQVAKMERERDRTRNPNHKEELRQLKLKKLSLKDKIYKIEKKKIVDEFRYDEHQGGVESFR